MEVHKRILAILYIISGAFQILGMIILSSIISIIIPFIMEEAGPEGQWVFMWIVPFIRVIAIGIIILFSIPSIIAGYGLLNNKKWALTLALVLGCFKLFSFPIGTAIGIYTIWVYAENHKHPASQS
ncbi:MAG TPA: hypothetical protein PKJ83_03880 [Cyclobacteriaceae bacterium]|nr:hypothetical protein [Cyclobacteriaceae bacterium]HPW62615.1 hypothetical protein [Cyclobacteriaceae bacterium]HRG79944.1 hypothetical protein [Cyclobacteriaceae bacterium]